MRFRKSHPERENASVLLPRLKIFAQSHCVCWVDDETVEMATEVNLKLHGISGICTQEHFYRFVLDCMSRFPLFV